MTVTNEIALLHMMAEQSAAVRTETLQGREHRVIPSVLVRSQVLHNNLGRALLPAADITEPWAHMWNGVPVLIGDHPQVRGQAISGRQPCLWDSRGAGWIFNAKVENESATVRRLTAEVWLDVTRAAAVPGLQAVLDKVDAGGVVELSTGFPVEINAQQGQFEGNVFELVMHPAGVDHLVVSTSMTGACSVRHGCGLGANEAAGDAQGARETAKDRALRSVGADNSNAASSFRTAALKVKQWFRGAEVTRAMKVIWGRRNAEPTGAQNQEERPLEANNEFNAAREDLARHSIAPSDQEHMNMVRDALQDKFGGGERTVVVCDVYSTSTPKLVVFWYSTPFGPQPAGAEYLRSSYEETGTAQFTFSEPVLVRRLTAYEEVATNAASAAAQTGVEDSMKPEDKQEIATMLEAIVKPIGERLTAVEATASKAVTDATQAANAAVTAANAQTTTAIAAVAASVAALTTAVNAEAEAEKATLVTELSTNNKTPFTAAELQAKPICELRKIAELANVPLTANYGARGGPRTSTNAAEEEFAAPLPYFQKPAANAAATTSEAK